MRLLTGEDRASTSFADAFLRATGHVVLTGAESAVARRQSWSEWARQLRVDVGWLKWPLHAWAPALGVISRRGAGSRQSVAAPTRSAKTTDEWRSLS